MSPFLGHPGRRQRQGCGASAWAGQARGWAEPLSVQGTTVRCKCEDVWLLWREQGELSRGGGGGRGGGSEMGAGTMRGRYLAVFVFSRVVGARESGRGLGVI